MLDTDGVKIVFEAARWDGTASGSLQVGGEGRSSGKCGSSDSTFSDRYGDDPGVCTMSFAGHTLRLSEAGRVLTLGSRVWKLAGGKKTVLVERDGTSKLLP